ncbi:MAG: single-stranded DNA-binding protein [Solobacterium sp.]|nr:single-stranded DNA-binding protein [Solobacterium sp.]
MINRVVLVGRLTKDVEVRKTPAGVSVASFTVACDRRFSRSADQQGQQTADFINCVAWRQSADFLGAYARKGALVGVDGRLQSRSYDREGQRVFVTEVVCDSVQLLESKSQSQARAQSGYQDNYQPSYSQPSYQNSYSQNAYPQNNYSMGSNDFGNNDGFDAGQGLDISSDDLPF